MVVRPAAASATRRREQARDPRPRSVDRASPPGHPPLGDPERGDPGPQDPKTPRPTTANRDWHQVEEAPAVRNPSRERPSMMAPSSSAPAAPDQVLIGKSPLGSRWLILIHPSICLFAFAFAFASACASVCVCVCMCFNLSALPRGSKANQMEKKDEEATVEAATCVGGTNGFVTRYWLLASGSKKTRAGATSYCGPSKGANIVTRPAATLTQHERIFACAPVWTPRHLDTSSMSPSLAGGQAAAFLVAIHLLYSSIHSPIRPIPSHPSPSPPLPPSHQSLTLSAHAHPHTHRTRTAHAPHALATRSHCTRSNTPSNRLHFTHPPSFSGPGACFRGLSPSTLDAPTQSQARPSISSWPPRSVSVGVYSLFLSFSALTLLFSRPLSPSPTSLTIRPSPIPVDGPAALPPRSFFGPVLYCTVPSSTQVLSRTASSSTVLFTLTTPATAPPLRPGATSILLGATSASTHNRQPGPAPGAPPA
ncbi:hypothetical protein BKA56DRAFT_659310 [Ilyonectria sp. MPI-CAGE-AT-0026]|nr:hypothetical protein BKA56DRAFT_659310 [Ilyonectria sp. MPI-CAGE-AT-0026]